MLAISYVIGKAGIQVSDVDPGGGLPYADQRSGTGNGSGLSRTLLIMLKIAVFAPIPSASVIRVARVNPGARAKRRKAYFKSRIKGSRTIAIPPTYYYD